MPDNPKINDHELGELSLVSDDATKEEREKAEKEAAAAIEAAHPTKP